MLTDDEYKALIRELHEATKDARTARRELRDEREQLRKDLEIAREMIGNDFKELSTRVVKDYMAALNAALERHAAEVNEMVARADGNIQQRAADLAGMKGPDEFLAYIVHWLGDDITGLLDERFTALSEEFFRGQGDAKRHRRQRDAPLPPAILPRLGHQIQLPGVSGK